MKLILENWKKYLKEEETPEVDENLLKVAREAVQLLIRTHAEITFRRSEETNTTYEPRYEFDSFPRYFTHQDKVWEINSKGKIKYGMSRIKNPDLLQKWRSLDDEGKERIREKVSNELHAFGETLQKIWDNPKLKKEWSKKLVRVTENSWVQAKVFAEDILKPEEPEESEV